MTVLGSAFAFLFFFCFDEVVEEEEEEVKDEVSFFTFSFCFNDIEASCAKGFSKTPRTAAFKSTSFSPPLPRLLLQENTATEMLLL